MGQNKVLEWAFKNWVWVNNNGFTATADYGGKLETLKLLRQYGYPWNANVVYWGEWVGHVEGAERARNNGCSTVRIGGYT